MSKMIKLSALEFINTIKTRGFLYAFLIEILYISAWIYVGPKAFSSANYQFEFFRVVNFILIYYSCAVLGKEFAFGTSKILFTGVYTRTQILIQKLFVILLMGTFFWICSRLAEIVIEFRVSGNIDISVFVSKDMLYSLVIYLLISFVICAFSLLIAAITCKFGSTMVISISVFGVLQFFIAIFYGLATKQSLTFTEQMITKIPNFIIFCWVMFWRIDIFQVITMLLWGGAFFAGSLLLINKRSLI